MKWEIPVFEATFLRRYKRFLADFRLPDDRVITAHCANTGSMVTCLEPHAPARLTYHDVASRKLKYSWQAIRMPDGWVGINTSLANHLVREAIENGSIGELQGYADLAAERAYGERSRIDLLLTGPGRADCYVEVKNVTLLLEKGVAGFPDAVTQRGAKHLEQLIAVMKGGARAVLLYCVQRESATRVAPAESYDPYYAQCLRDAVSQGLEVYAYRADFEPGEIRLTRPIPMEL